MIRGRWIFDRQLMELVPAAEFYARKYADTKASDKIAAPMVIGDTQPYRSVIDGSVIGGRRQHRDHLKAYGCIELGNEMPTPRAGPTRPPKHEVIEDIKRSMEDSNLRAEALAASKRAMEALPE